MGQTLTPDDIDGAFVPVPGSGVLALAVGTELVITDAGGHVHMLNPTAALVWQSLDGEHSLDTLAEELSSATGTDLSRVSQDVIGLTRELGRMGLLDGVAPAPVRAARVAPEPLKVGETLPSFELFDLDGRKWTLEELLDRRLLLVNWSPRCEYCVRIGRDLAALQDGLAEHGIRLAFLTVGPADETRKVLETAGLSSPALLKQDGTDPFKGFGTPVAYLVDPDGTVSAPLAYGALNVPALARELAGAAPSAEARTSENGPLTRYLPVAAQVCGAGAGNAGRSTDWTATRAYAFGEFHVGIRVNSEETAEVLDRLFTGARVEDLLAPDNYSLALYPPTGGGVREFNRLVADGDQRVRSRSSSRALRGLLAHLSAQLEPPDPSLIRLRAIPALRDGQGLLLPPGAIRWLPELQPRLARLGIQLADMPWTLVDPAACELVVPEPPIDHDASVLGELDADVRLGSELPAVAPGRYPLQALYLSTSKDRVGPLPLVAGVAFAVGLLLGPPGDVSERGESTARPRPDADRLVGVLERVPAYGVRFSSPQELVDQMSGARPDLASSKAVVPRLESGAPHTRSSPPTRSPRRRVRALFDLRSVLSAPDGPEGATQRARDLSPAAWAEVRVLADELAVTPSVWSALQRLDIEPPPSELESFRQHYSWNAARNEGLRHGLTEAVEALNAAHIVPLLFKGSLSLVNGSVDDVGGRFMADLDMAVPPEALTQAVDTLREVGYEPLHRKRFEPMHDLPLVSRDTSAVIDLHVELGSQPVERVLPASDAWAASSELRFGSAQARGLSPTHQVLHCILHSALQDVDHASAGLPLRQLLTLTHLARAHGSAMDWSEINTRAENHGVSGVVRDHLWLAHRLAGLPLPHGRWDGARPRLYELRVLANFSLGWPADLHRNLHLAFESDHLDSLYAHGGSPPRLAAARVRHAVQMLQRDWRGNSRKAFRQH
jgi:peroxiredoxin